VARSLSKVAINTQQLSSYKHDTFSGQEPQWPAPFPRYTQQLSRMLFQLKNHSGLLPFQGYAAKCCRYLTQGVPQMQHCASPVPRPSDFGGRHAGVESRQNQLHMGRALSYLHNDLRPIVELAS
jgi:hypothetical protein